MISRSFGVICAWVAAAGIALSGCSTTSSESNPAPRAADSASGHYSSIEALKSDFIAAGGNCSNGVSATFRHAKAGIDCQDGYTNLLLFEDKSSAVEWAQASSALCNEMVDCQGGTLVGNNWAIVTQAPELFKDALGGTIIE